MPNSYLELRHITIFLRKQNEKRIPQLEVHQFFSKFGTGEKFLNRMGKTKTVQGLITHV